MRAVVLLIIVAGISAVAAFFGQPLMHENTDAVTVIITVMTVFAGFLVAIITILGDPALFPQGNWRTAELQRDNVAARLAAHIWLFVIYLVAIALLFVGVLLNKATGVPEEVKTWVQRLYLFFATFSFFLTLALPQALWKFQLARLDAEIDRRRKAHGLED
jgi:hypothetical protein